MLNEGGRRTPEAAETRAREAETIADEAKKGAPEAIEQDSLINETSGINRPLSTYGPDASREICEVRLSSKREGRDHELPFETEVKLSDAKGITTSLPAIIDDGATINAIDASTWKKIRPTMTEAQQSTKALRMADGNLVQSQGTWMGSVETAGVVVEQPFEIYDANESFKALLGKPWLKETKAIHDYETDTIEIKKGTETIKIENDGDKGNDKRATTWTILEDMERTAEREIRKEVRRKREGMKAKDVRKITKVSTEAPASERMIDPFGAERVKKVKAMVEIGPDLSLEQRTTVEELVEEFADIFALNLREVWPVDFITHKLTVDPTVKLPTRMPQRPLAGPQREWYMETLDEMEAGGIIERVSPEQVKCVSLTTLPPKDKGESGLTKEEIQKRVNEECRKKGFEAYWPEPEETTSDRGPEPETEQKETKKAKWRICHAFIALNKATQVPPFPQGDLAAKQQQVAGKRWASVMDFASGYYAIAMDEDSKMYTAFCVEGRGFYVYKRMPFGLTGAPTTFCEMLAIGLGEMVNRDLVAWMDDVCIAGNEFGEKLERLRKFFAKCREKKLSLAPPKCKLFHTEVPFAGVMLSPDGIRPNRKKIATVLDWPEPDNAHELSSFLGLTSFFRRMIKNYARVAAPLSDLLRDIDTGIQGKQTGKKGMYKRQLEATKLEDKWTPKHTETMLKLKVILTTEPLLKPPQYDGRPFRVTTDGSIVGFGGMLCQEFESEDDKGNKVKRWHPIAFCSKRASRSEEKYKQFLSEFVALKYCLDEFEDMTFGQPIILETDCQALRDMLKQERPSATHARWLDSILSHRIIDIVHRPGVENPVADALSRKWSKERPQTEGDGSQETVTPDWEDRARIENNIFAITTEKASQRVLNRFADDAYFADIAKFLADPDTLNADKRARKKAEHRAEGFMIEDERLWRIAGKGSKHGRKVECIPVKEGIDKAREAHMEGHFGRDHTKLRLQRAYFWPKMDADVRDAITTCATCKNFGPRHVNALLQPIRRRQPFELVSGDYLSLPKGKGGFKTIGLFIDVCSNFVWVCKLKTAGTAKSTVDMLKRIADGHKTPDSFMADGASHFTGTEVVEFCEERGIAKITTPPYAPWVNGLSEGGNKIFLNRMNRLCAPDLDQTAHMDVDPQSLPYNWPDYIDEAVRQMNDRVLPAIGFTPREILLGLPFETKPESPETGPLRQPNEDDVLMHLAFADGMRAEAHAAALREAESRKKQFDKKVKPVTFTKGDLVQVYDSKQDTSMAAINKIILKWSPPRRVTSKLLNSYTLETLAGAPLRGAFHANRLRLYSKGASAVGEQGRDEVGEVDNSVESEDGETEGEGVEEREQPGEIARTRGFSKGGNL